MTDVLWQTVLGEIEVTVSRASFATWFKNTMLIGTRDGRVTVGVPNIFTKRQFEDKFNPLVYKTLKKNGIEVESIDYKVTDIAVTKPVSTLAGNLVYPTSSATKLANSNLNTRYSFDNFVVGSSNELAYATAQAIAREPGTKYNPFFLYGGVGLGKTHLIQAIGNAIAQRNPDATVEYVTSERFKNEFISSILRSSKTFSNKYRNVDVLIVDDMQFIAGKEKTQEEFFHTFNTLHQNNKQIIISSDKPPKAIPTLEERLRSRFEWGMTVDIQAPDFETRMAIIQAKATTLGGNVPPSVVEYLAAQVPSNIRELEGALTKLLAHCEMRGLIPTFEIVQELMNGEGKQKRITPKQIVEKTARFFNVATEEVMGSKRDKDIVQARQIAMYMLRHELNLSFPQVARLAGRSDHSTAMHSVTKIERTIASNQQLRQQLLELKEKLYV